MLKFLIYIYNFCRFFGKIKSYAFVSPRAKLIPRGLFFATESSRIRSFSLVNIKTSGGLFLGENSEIKEYSFITCKFNLKIGDHSCLGAYNFVDGNSDISIGNYVRIGPSCQFVSSSHNYNDPHLPIHNQGFTSRGIVISDNVWIGSGVCIMDGVTIGCNVVVGSGSVVTKSLQPNGIYGGVPAKFIKSIYE